MSEERGQCEGCHGGVSLTEPQIEMIAERAAEKAMEKMTAQFYQNVGKGVVRKSLTIIGVTAMVFYFWLTSKGIKVF